MRPTQKTSTTGARNCYTPGLIARNGDGLQKQILIFFKDVESCIREAIRIGASSEMS
jgi:hypothetical protein